MENEENPIEEKKTATARFAEWLMARDERRSKRIQHRRTVKVQHFSFNCYSGGSFWNDCARLCHNGLVVDLVISSLTF